jgi:hypothetical protein
MNNKIENNLRQAYNLLVNIVGESEHIEVEEAIGFIAEALDLVEDKTFIKEHFQFVHIGG